MPGGKDGPEDGCLVPLGSGPLASVCICIGSLWVVRAAQKSNDLQAVSVTGLASPELSCYLMLQCRVLDRFCWKKSKYNTSQGTDFSKGAALLSNPNTCPLRAADTWMYLVIGYPQSPFSGKQNIKLARRMELKKN